MLPTNIERRLTNAESRTESLGMTQGRLKEELQIARNLLDTIKRSRFAACPHPNYQGLTRAECEALDKEVEAADDAWHAANDAMFDEMTRILQGPAKRVTGGQGGGAAR